MINVIFVYLQSVNMYLWLVRSDSSEASIF